MTRSVRNMRTPAGEARGRRRKLGTGILLLLGLFAGFIGLAPMASAHNPTMTASVACGTAPGTYIVTYTSTADLPDASRNNSSIEIYWGETGTVVWPTSSTLSPPTGADLGASGSYSSPNWQFGGTFTITPDPGATQIDVISHAASTFQGSGQAGHWTSTSATNGIPITLALPDCAPPSTPSASAQLVCPENKININFTGVGSATTVDITKNGLPVAGGTGVNVPVGASSFDVPLVAGDEDTTVVIGLNYAAASATDQTLNVPVDCTSANLDLQSVVECVTVNGVLGVNVTVTNTGTQAGSITLTTLVGGAAGPSLTFTNVAPGVPQTQFLAVPEDSAYSVSGPGVTTQSGTNDCAEANLGLVEVVECATVDGVQGINVTISNNGGQDGSATVTPTVGGVVGAGVVFDVPALGSVTKFIEVGEDVGYSLSFAGDFGTPQADVTGTNDCATPPPADVQGEVVTRTPTPTPTPTPAPQVGGAQLPRTGSNTMSLLSLAGALLLAGAALVAGGRRRQDEVLSYDGDLPTTVLVDGIAVEVPAGASESYFIPLAEDATTDVLVTSGDDVLYDANVVRNRETVGGKTVTRGPTALSRTGSNTMSLLSLAGALLLAGAALVAGGRRRQAEVLS